MDKKNPNYRYISLRYVEYDDGYNVNELIQWFGKSIGLFGPRDREKSCFRLFVELFKAGANDSSLTSDELASLLSLSRGTVIHHLDRLIEIGLVSSRKNKYFIKEKTFEELIKTLEEDINTMLENLKVASKKLDDDLAFLKH
ncbi:MAG TPA: ArsR family transcriptional regulator [Candidatus Woesearchaeota archaeon]|nr:ArsR family transcriptional regulator [Candidatus Woesearchaeota archaeon]